ncbi:hypothetical protein EDB60_110167 [Vibrio crassostreae]|uniref:hypothetical protein n=1 Tax=Vibrio crassostreae TaxID=246167 RepID=UPI001045EAFD|nr:hypothetical protein [Vibrio crassostreae]TCN66976.1 hypothetical protein EDB60_110167 [Vibrio crassostreae]CAK3140145.1 DUF2798 domain-containing protein [Vibrio crassostreae]CAK3154118.1 DUF2798 domain-containing protein [Vibrio crassostreae]CAK3302093.1 DUF2798 domain-containing protein [Vibrio crassostreae]CAK3645284.1 DUF2798 domain-containing protein [Vibrio crassostreae]
MSFKDFFFWIITWALIAAMGFAILLFSVKIAGKFLSGNECLVLAFVSWAGLSILAQPRLKTMFGYKTGLDKK